MVEIRNEKTISKIRNYRIGIGVEIKIFNPISIHNYTYRHQYNTILNYNTTYIKVKENPHFQLYKTKIIFKYNSKPKLYVNRIRVNFNCSNL